MNREGFSYHNVLQYAYRLLFVNLLRPSRPSLVNLAATVVRAAKGKTSQKRIAEAYVFGLVVHIIGRDQSREHKAKLWNIVV